MPLRQLFPDSTANDGANAKYVDIVAVHGLNPQNKKVTDHAWDTWRKPAGPNGRLWLRDDLPQDLPEARIFLYEYDSTVVFKSDKSTFLEKANEFLEALRTKREDAKDRPLILLGHSLGGLLIEQALVNAHNNPKYTHIQKATTGLAFFGTPHNGGNKLLVQMGDVAAKIATAMDFRKGSDVLETLKDGSIFTGILHEHWRHQLIRYNIVSFWGSEDNIVHKESSQFGLPGDRENIVKLNADHGDVCRFGTSQVDQDNFELVRSNVKDLYKSAINIAQPLVQGTSTVLDKEDRKCLQALFVTDPSDDMKRIQDTKDNRVEGTGLWILADSTYKKWLEHERSQILWIHGNPGKGKTMFAISQVLQLKNNMERSNLANATLSYFFCDAKDERLGNAVMILRSLLHQLLCQHPKAIKYIRHDYDKQGQQLFSSLNAQQSLWRIFESILGQLEHHTTWFVIDALDECEPVSRGILLDCIKSRVHGQSKQKEPATKSREKWILTSRNEFSIREIMDDSLDISLEFRSNAVSSDVQRFIHTKVEELTNRKKYDRNLRTEITQTLQDKAENTFLWVSLACAELRKVRRIEAKRVLSKLPRGLDALYKTLLSGILTYDDEDQKRQTVEILVSVLLAVRPLTLSELAVLAGLPKEHRNDPSLILEHMSLCISFLNVRAWKVYLVHQSAKDYLTSAQAQILSTDRLEEHKMLTIRCFDFIHSGEFLPFEITYFELDSDTSTGDTSSTKDEHTGGSMDIEVQASSADSEATNAKDKISWTNEDSISEEKSLSPILPNLMKLEYPVLFWMTHGRLASPEIGDYFSQRQEFFSPACELRNIWFYRYWPSTHRLEWEIPMSFSATHLAAYSGILPLVFRVLQQTQLDINKIDSLKKTALHWAAENGYQGVVQMLLEHGAVVDAADENGNTVLHLAAQNGHQGVVQMLLEHGAVVDAKNKQGNTVLHWAAENGYQRVVQMLLEHGAVVDAGNKDGYTALHWAAFNGHQGVIQMLLEHGAVVDAKNKQGNTALHWAASDGRQGVVQMLLEHGAAADVRNKYGNTALHRAAQSGHQRLVRILLEHGAAINVENTDSKTPLDLATDRGYKLVIKVLAAAGADRGRGRMIDEQEDELARLEIADG